MNDDWRVRIELHDPGVARELTEQLEAGELEHDLARSFHDQVIVSHDGSEVFCYAGTRAQAEQAAQVVRGLAGTHSWEAGIELRHWHPVADEWQDPDAAEPSTPAQQEAERGERVADEREESAGEDYPEMEVRVQLGSRHEAAQLSHRLREEGIPHVHRWTYLLIGATDEDSANALAQRLRDDAPADSQISVELNRRFVYEHRPQSPFNVLGGFGG
jgi:hypothetical protein